MLDAERGECNRLLGCGIGRVDVSKAIKSGNVSAHLLDFDLTVVLSVQQNGPMDGNGPGRGLIVVRY